MQLHSFILQVLPKSPLDSSFQSIKKINPDSLFSVENPLVFSLMLLAVALAVTYIYYRYVIIPMKKKHLKEEENLRLQQAELMSLFAELSPDAVFRFDENGKIILANNSAHKIFPDRMLLGEKVQNILPFMNNYDIKEVIANERTLNYTTSIRESHFQFIVEGIKKLNICQAYGRDITALKNTEVDLKEALIKAEESKRLKEYFLAQMSHEIRSPLNVIVGYADILADELSDEKKEELGKILRSMKNNSKRLYRTFDLLLNMSQLQTGKYEARFEKVNLFALLKTIQVELNSLAGERGLKLNLINRIEENVTVIADHYSLTQIFINLIDNSIKYTNEGKIDIVIYRENSSVCIDITDTGKGMSKEYISRLFVPFTQEEMGYSRKYEGTGLGLAIVKSFIDINRAKIKVKSEVGYGSTFTVIINGDKRW